MDKFISICAILGVTTTTLRRWENDGKLIANYRTFGNHRRYCLKYQLINKTNYLLFQSKYTLAEI